MASFAKVFSRKGEKSIDYTPTENVLEELRVLEKQKGWSIFASIKVLLKGDADSFSLTKDNPYHYFYARVTSENVVLKLKTKESETEFRIPVQEFSSR